MADFGITPPKADDDPFFKTASSAREDVLDTLGMNGDDDEEQPFSGLSSPSLRIAQAPTAPAVARGGASSLDSLLQIGAGSSRPKPVEKKDDGNFGRRLSDAFTETKGLTAGTAAFVADVFGADKIRDNFLKSYGETMKQVEARSKESDSLSNVLEGNGDFIDWLQAGAGYVTGQAIQTLAAAGAGAILGSAAPGAGTIAGGLAGLFGREGVKTGLKKILADKLQAYEAKALAEKMTEQAAREFAVRQAFKGLGAAAAVQTLNMTQELGSIFPEAVEEAQKTGEEYSLGRVLSAAALASGVDTLTDIYGIKVLKGAKGGGAILPNIAREGFKQGLIEGGTEGVQTVLERFGAKKDLANDEAIREYVDSVGLGALGGGLRGGLTGVAKSFRPEDTETKPAGEQEQPKIPQETIDARQKMLDDPEIGPKLQANGITSVEDPRFEILANRIFDRKPEVKQITEILGVTRSGVEMPGSQKELFDSLSFAKNGREFVQEIQDNPDLQNLLKDMPGTSGFEGNRYEQVMGLFSAATEPKGQTPIIVGSPTQTLTGKENLPTATTGKESPGLLTSVEQINDELAKEEKRTQDAFRLAEVRRQRAQQEVGLSGIQPLDTQAGGRPGGIGAQEEFAYFNPVIKDGQMVSGDRVEVVSGDQILDRITLGGLQTTPERAIFLRFLDRPNQPEFPVPLSVAKQYVQFFDRPEAPRQAQDFMGGVSPQKAGDGVTPRAFSPQEGVMTDPDSTRGGPRVATDRITTDQSQQFVAADKAPPGTGVAPVRGGQTFEAEPVSEKLEAPGAARAKAVSRRLAAQGGAQVSPAPAASTVAPPSASQTASQAPVATTLAAPVPDTGTTVTPSLPESGMTMPNVGTAAAQQTVSPSDTKAAPKKTFEVTMTSAVTKPRTYTVNADSAAEANKIARVMADEAGHLPPSKSGRTTFKAKEIPANPPGAEKAKQTSKRKTKKASQPEGTNNAAQEGDQQQGDQQQRPGTGERVQEGGREDRQREAPKSETRAEDRRGGGAQESRQGTLDLRRSYPGENIKSIDDLNKAAQDVLDSEGNGEKFRAVKVPIGDIVGKVPGIGLIQATAKLFGKPVVFFKVVEGTDFFNGTVIRGSDTIFLNVNSTHPHIRIFGHELVHAIRTTDPATYEKLLTALKPLLLAKGFSEFSAKLMSEGVTTDHKILEEAVGDIVGDRFGETAFWEMLAENNPTGFRAVAKAVIDFIDNILGKLSGKYTLGSETLVKDLQSARREIARILGEAAPGTADGKGSGMDLARKRESDAGHKREKESGRYVGAPDWVGSSPQQLVNLRKKLKQLAQEGTPGRYWYEQSSKAILELAGGDKAEAERIVALIAIYSPNATVPANTSMALRAYYQHKAGLPIKAGLGDGNKKAEQLLRENKMWSGIKTNSFYQNLMVEINPSRLEEGVATMDMWMAIAFDYGMKTLDQGPKYKFAQREIQRLAKELGWTAHQTQAAIWTAMKGRVDPIRDQLKQEELRLGIGEMVEKVDEKTGKTKSVYVVKPERKYEHFRLAHKMGMDYALEQKDIEESKYDFSDAIRERTAQMSWEATPGAKTGVLPGLLKAPMDQKFEYLRAVSEVLTDKDGIDVIAKRIGLPSGKTFFGFSAWDGDIGAGAQTLTGVAMEGVGDKRDVTPEARSLLNLYAAIKGYVLNQEAVVWHVPTHNGAKKNQNGYEAKFNRALTEDEMSALYTALHAEFGIWDIAPGYTEDGFRLLNFDVDNKVFQEGVARALGTLPSDFGGGLVDAVFYRSVGDYISNDWINSPNGEGYVRQIESATVQDSGTGSPDLQAWTADLRSRVQAVNQRFSEKYGWGNPGTAPRQTGEVTQQTPPEGGVSVSGLDLSRKRSPVGFYSALAAGISEIKTNSAPASGWKDIIKGLVNKGQVKQDEVEWSGVNDWLDLQQGKVSKEQVSEYLSNNGVQVEEVVLGAGRMPRLPDGWSLKPTDDYNGFGDAGFVVRDQSGDEMGSGATEREAMREAADPNELPGTVDTKFQKWTLPGGENYREVLLTLPIKWDESRDPNFRSTHWDQPNVVAHIRMNDRTDADGKSVLFVEEIQSDWGQEGKKKGFKQPPAKSLPEGTEVFPPGSRPDLLKPDAKIWTVQLPTSMFGRSLFYGDSREEVEANAREFIAQKSLSAVPTAPFVTKTEGWVNLALKKIMVMASEGGYDRVAFINGEQSADRYDLSKSLDAVEVRGNEGTSTVTVYASKNNQNVITKVVRRDSLDEVIGKDLAKRSISDLDSGKDAVYTGLDLKVGGEGMKAFYDQIVPAALKKLLPKVGGGQMGTVEIGTGSAEWQKQPDGMERRVRQTTEQPGFDVTDAMRQKAEEGLPMFSRKRAGAPFTAAAQTTLTEGPSWMTGLPQDMQDSLRKVGAVPAKLTLGDRFKAMKENFGAKVVQGVFDKFRRIQDLDPVAYMQARMSTAVDGAFEYVVTTGQVKWEGGWLKDVPGTKGLYEILKQLPAGEIDRFFWWIAANRAERLSTEEREFLFSGKDIASLKRLNQSSVGQKVADRPIAYAKVLSQLNQLNKSVLDVAKESGLINQEQYARYAADAFYVPFYRLMEEGDIGGPATAAGLVGQNFSKRLKGGKEQLNDLLANYMNNWDHVLTASAKNRAGRSTLDAAVNAGIATEVKGDPPKGAVKVMVDGKAKYYEVNDPMLLDSISSLYSPALSGYGVKIMGAFKRTFTKAVTISPVFKFYNNLIRDAITSQALSPELSNNPIANTYRGFKLNDPKNPLYNSMLVGGGLFKHATWDEGDRHAYVKRLIDKGVDPNTILNTPEKVKEFMSGAFSKYMEFGDRFENAQRAAIYEQAIKSGKSQLEAAFLARQPIDFSLTGSSAAIRYLTAILPFFNARLQGLYSLGKYGIAPTVRVMSNMTTGMPSDATDVQRAARFSAVAGAVTAATILLYLMYKDDEDFKRREDWDRDGFWWFKIGGVGWRIPKPFEIGAFATIVERGLEQVVDSSVEGKVFGRRLWAVVTDQLSMNLIPQVIRPAVDVYANYDSFRDQRIEALSMQRLPKEYRSNPNTSFVANAFGSISGEVAGVLKPVIGSKPAEAVQLSPVQIDFLIKGYLGWVGAQSLAVADSMARTATGAPEQPTPRFQDRLPVKALLGGTFQELPTRGNKMVGQFYEQAREIDEVMSAIRHFRAAKDFEKANQLLEENRDKVALSKMYAKAQTRLNEVNKRIRLVTADKAMSADEKRANIDQLEQIRDEIAASVESARKSTR